MPSLASQTFSKLSELAETIHLPSRLKAALLTSLTWPFSVSISRPDSASQTLTVLSLLAETIRFPSGLNDAVVIPLRWRSGDAEHCLALEADLEIAAFGSNVTHLHLLGRYALPPSIERWSAESSRAHRATVSAVRRFLQMVAEQLDDVA